MHQSSRKWWKIQIVAIITIFPPFLEIALEFKTQNKKKNALSIHLIT